MWHWSQLQGVTSVFEGRYGARGLRERDHRERAVRAGAAVGVVVGGSARALSIERVMRDGHLVTARV